MKSAILVVLLATVAFLTVTPGAAQVRPDRAPRIVSSSGAPPVSPRAVVSWYYEHVTSEAPRLLFLVMYRGEPGWNLRNAAGDRHGVGARSRMPPDGGVELQPLEVRHVAGGVDLGITVDAAREVLTVLGQELSLAEHNVFLVDRVDGVGGPPEIVGRLKIELDPALDFRGPDQFDVRAVVNRIAELRGFAAAP